MKKISVVIITALLAFAELSAQVPKELNDVLLSGNTVGSSSQGYEFFIAIPPNETASFTTYGALEIYVASTKPTEITLMDGYDNKVLSKKSITVPLGIVTFSSLTGEINFQDMELRETETILNKSLRIVSSSNPVSVYVFNGKPTTTEGFMAIPTSSLGKEYIHICYYDNNEGYDQQTKKLKHGSGFVIISSENNTNVRIDLKGAGGEFGTTTSGKKIGDTIEIVLNRGQVYMVQGDGQTDGLFDLTGSKITSDKPIGVISFHQRCDIPALIKSSRDHLCEMMPPVSSWGKRYATVEFDGSTNGDFFRIVAAEDNTDFDAVWYDKKTNLKLGSKSGKLLKSGDFVDVIDIKGKPEPGESGVRGVSVYQANKPIFVMHYAISELWDNLSMFDPFMVCVSSVEQFTKMSVFQTPDYFGTNKLNIIAIGDTNDIMANEMLLKSILLDGEALYIKAPDFIQNRIPGTNLFWVSVSVTPGSHHITGETPFGGYIYGRASINSYGWPASMAVNDYSYNDQVKPSINVQKSTDNSYKIYYSEESDGNNSGISFKPTLLLGSSNFSEPVFEEEFKSYPPKLSGYFTLNVIDENENAIAYFSVMDRAGNEAVDSIVYLSTSVKPEIVSGDIKLFPIPANDIITISSDKILSFNSGKIVDAIGETYITFSQKDIIESGNNIDISRLPQGAYMLILSVDDKMIARKFTVSR